MHNINVYTLAIVATQEEVVSTEVRFVNSYPEYLIRKDPHRTSDHVAFKKNNEGQERKWANHWLQDRVRLQAKKE